MFTTYWVDPAGNNSNVGTTPTAAFATITHAASLAVAGDTINVDGGTYRDEHISFPNSGTATNRIILQASINSNTQRPEAVNIYGSVAIANTAWSLSTGHIYKDTAWNDYFPVENASAKDAQSQPGNQFFYVNGTAPEKYLSEVTSQSALTAGSFYVDHPNHTVYVWTTDGTSPTTAGVTIEGTNQGVNDEYGPTGFQPILNTNAHSYITVSNLHFDHFSGWYQDGEAMVVDGTQSSGTSSYNVFSNDSFTFAGAVGLWVNQATSSLFVGDTFTQCGDYGLAGTDLNSCIFRSQTLTYNDNEPDKRFDQGSAGAMKIADSTGTVFDTSLVANNGGIGIWFDVNDQQTTIDNNVVDNNLYNGIQYEISYTATIENNRSYGNGNISQSVQSFGIMISSSSGCTVDYNTLYGNTAQGIDIVSYSNRSGVNYWGYSNLVEFNIIADNQTIANTKSYAIGWGDDLSNVDACKPTTLGPGISKAVPNLSDHNVFYYSAAGAVFFIGSGSNRFSTLAQWQAASGQDLHSTYAVDPGFADTTSFALTSTSPALALGDNSVLIDATDVPVTADVADNGSLYGNYATNTSSLQDSGWQDLDINSSGGVGSKDSDPTGSESVIRITGAGAGVSGTADALHFSAQPIGGDSTVLTNLYRLTSTSPAAVAGVMFRDGYNLSNSAIVSLLYSQSGSTGTLTFSARTAVGTTETTLATVGGLTASPWLKVVRTGNSFAACFSSNGTDWIQVGSPVSVPMTSAYGGFAVASGSSTPSANALFLDTVTGATVTDGIRPAGMSNAGAMQNVLRPLPSPWTDADVAASPFVGYAHSGQGGTFYVAGGGPDITGGGDHFNYLSQSSSGNATIITEVLSQQNTNGSAKAGPMFRNSTSSTDPFAGIFVTPTNIQFEWRTASGATAGLASASGGPAPIWLKLTRTGNVFTAFDSHDGYAWTQVGVGETVAMAGDGSGNILAGLAVTSHNTFNPSTDTGKTSLVVFSNTSIGSATAISPPVVPSPYLFTAVRDVNTLGTSNLAWADMTDDVTSYTIERSTTANISSATVLATLSGPANAYADSSTATDTTYYYWIFGSNAAGSTLPQMFTLN